MEYIAGTIAQILVVLSYLVILLVALAVGYQLSIKVRRKKK
jgi:hypothetical protein